MKTLLYHTVKIIIKSGFVFYNQKTTILGTENIPKDGAVVFLANHTNGLIDPLLIASNIKRKTHFLVRASVFKNPKIATFFDWMGMMPVYRMVDGIRNLTKNDEIFNKCEGLLNNRECLLLFPEGSHLFRRTIRPLSKGFTRIIFGTLAKNPKLKIHIIPVGVTYKNVSEYPSKATLLFGKPILANSFYNPDEIHNSTNLLKERVTHDLRRLSVYIKEDENYDTVLTKLNNAHVDFSEVSKVNSIIKSKQFPQKTIVTKRVHPLRWIIIINSILPYLLWKKASKKITEIEFVDTFRFGLNIVIFPIFYILQSYAVSFLFGWKLATAYFITSILLIWIYVKTASTNK